MSTTPVYPSTRGALYSLASSPYSSILTSIVKVVKIVLSAEVRRPVYIIFLKEECKSCKAIVNQSAILLFILLFVLINPLPFLFTVIYPLYCLAIFCLS